MDLQCSSDGIPGSTFWRLMIDLIDDDSYVKCFSLCLCVSMTKGICCTWLDDVGICWMFGGAVNGFVHEDLHNTSVH